MDQNGHAAYKNEEDRRLARTISVLIWATWVGFLFIIIIGMVFNDHVLIALTLFGSALLVVPMVQLRQQKLQASSLLLVLIEIGVVTIIATVGQGIRDLALFGFPIIILFAGLVLESVYFRTSVGLMLLAILWLALGEIFGWFVTKPFEGEMSTWFYLIGMMIIILLAALAADLLAKNVRMNLALAHHEISQRKRAEEEAKNNENRFHALIEHGRDQISLLAADGNLLWESPSVHSTLGYAPDQHIGKNIFNLMHPEDRVWMGEMFTQILGSPGSIQDAEMRLMHADGTWRWIECFATNLLNEPSVQAVVLNYRDITDRKLAEDARHHSEEISGQMAEQLQTVIQIGNKITSDLGFDGLMQMIYQQCQQIGDTDTFYVATYDDQTGMLRFPFFMKEGQLRDIEERNIKENSGVTGYVIKSQQTLYIPDQSNPPAGLELIRMSGIPTQSYIGVPLILNKRVGGVVSLQSNSLNAYTPEQIRTLELVATQVAIAIQNSQLYEQVKQELVERKRAEQEVFMLNSFLEKRVGERTQELREAQDQLVRKEKLATLGMLAGSVGHELRNPLGVINTSIYYLDLVQPRADEKIKQHHAMIKQEVRNADKIISDLLDFGRNINAERELVSVPEIVQSTLDRFPVPASVDLKLKFPADLPKVFADPRQVEQILGNLITNACQVMVSESSTTDASSGGKLTISAKKLKELVAISVEDTGRGISPENINRIFEPLYTTKTKGIGLGLAVSRKMAVANGGRLEVESELGKGSTFWLYLPAGEE